MKLHFPLLLTCALLSAAAQAETLSGIGVIEPITITLEDLDPNDGITPQTEENIWYEPTAEFYLSGSSGSAGDVKALNADFGFLNVNLTPAYSSLTGIYTGGDWGGFNMQSSFSAAQVLSGFMYQQRHITVTPKTRIRIKTKATVQGFVDSTGPAIPDTAKLIMSSTVSLKHFGTYVGNKHFYQTLDKAAGSVFQEEDVEFVFENNSEYPTTLIMYYDLQTDGGGAE